MRFRRHRKLIFLRVGMWELYAGFGSWPKAGMYRLDVD